MLLVLCCWFLVPRYWLFGIGSAKRAGDFPSGVVGRAGGFGGTVMVAETPLKPMEKVRAEVVRDSQAGRRRAGRMMRRADFFMGLC